MTTKPTIQEAVEIIAEHVRIEDIAACLSLPGECADCDRLRAALAALDGIHVNGSKFKIGDEVHIIAKVGGVWSPAFVDRVDAIKLTADGVVICAYPEADCFPTREAAEAECAKRNKEASRE